MLPVVKRCFCIALLLLLPTIARAQTPDAPPAPTDDFSSHEWELTDYLKGTPDHIRQTLNVDTERLIRTVKETQAAIKQGTLDCQDDEKRALDAVHKSAVYQQTAAEKASAEADLATARKSGTAEDRLDASSRFNKARFALEKMDHDAVANCEPLLQDQRALFEAKKNLKNFTEALDKAIAWRNELLDATRNGFMFKGPVVDGSKGTLPRITIEKVVADDQVLAGYDLLTYDMDHPQKDKEGIKVFPATKARVHVLITGIDAKDLKAGEKTNLDRVFVLDEKKQDEKKAPIYVVKPYPCDADRLFETIVPLRETMPPDYVVKPAAKP
jgi:hypothetical protein